MQLPLMPGSEARYCVWRSGHEFCLPLEQVTEIIPFPQLTVVPRTPPFLLGIAEYGRTVLPVIYLADQNLVRAAEEAAPRRWRAVVIATAERAGKVLRLGFAAEQVETAAGSAPLAAADAPSFAPRVVKLESGRSANLLNIATVIEVFCIPPL